MTQAEDLANRIDAEFSAHEDWMEKLRSGQLADYEGRRDRPKLFDPLCERLKAVWGPKLEMLARRFGERVEVKPSLTPGRREAKFAFESKVASIELVFSASTDSDVRRLVLSCDLRIIPILMKFEPHSELEFPLDDVDDQAVGRWVDDRIVDFVRTYLGLHQNEYYLKDEMVEDPVSGTRFPKDAAASTLEWKGKTYHFIAAETRSEFEQRNAVPAAAAPR